MIKGLDRYLTSEPPDDNWYEWCVEHIVCTDEQWEKNEKRIDFWMDRLRERYNYKTGERYDYKTAAAIISKTLKRFYAN